MTTKKRSRRRPRQRRPRPSRCSRLRRRRGHAPPATRTFSPRRRLTTFRRNSSPRPKVYRPRLGRPARGPRDSSDPSGLRTSRATFFILSNWPFVVCLAKPRETTVVLSNSQASSMRVCRGTDSKWSVAVFARRGVHFSGVEKKTVGR